MRSIRRRRESGQGMVEYGLMLGLVAIFVIFVMVKLWSDRSAMGLLGDIDGYEGQSKVAIRDMLLNQSGNVSQGEANYLSGALTEDDADDIDIY